MDKNRIEELGQTVGDSSVGGSLREPRVPAADDGRNRGLGSRSEPTTLGSGPSTDATTTLDQPAALPDEPPIRVMALHALLYCERLFYLEEVEEIRVADAAVYAGRRLHDDVVPLDDETPEQRSVQVSSERWGIFGKVDALRRRDGAWVAYEHKRGRCRRGDDKRPMAWPSDRVQAAAYAVLLEEALGEAVPQARVRYHADNVTAFVDINDEARQELAKAIERARQLRHTTDRAMRRGSVVCEKPVFWKAAPEMRESYLTKPRQPRHLQPVL